MTSESEAGLDNALGAIEVLRRQEQNVVWEVKRLRAIEAWAKGQQPVAEGQAVVIADSFPPIEPGSGWCGERDCLVPGSTGVIEVLWFQEHTRVWRGGFVPDVEWSVASWGNEDRIYPRAEGKHHQFSIPVEHLRPRTADDAGITMPEIPVVHDVEPVPGADRSICDRCQRPIRLTGKFWRHES